MTRERPARRARRRPPRRLHGRPKYKRPSAPMTPRTRRWMAGRPRSRAITCARQCDGLRGRRAQRSGEQIAAANQNLRIAEARLLQAGPVRFNRAALFRRSRPAAPAPSAIPGTVPSDTDASTYRASGMAPRRHLARLDMSYEIDLWAGFDGRSPRRDTKPSHRGGLETARLSLQAELAFDYFELRAATPEAAAGRDGQSVRGGAQAHDESLRGRRGPKSDVAQAQTQLDTTRRRPPTSRCNARSSSTRSPRSSGKPPRLRPVASSAATPRRTSRWACRPSCWSGVRTSRPPSGGSPKPTSRRHREGRILSDRMLNARSDSREARRNLFNASSLLWSSARRSRKRSSTAGVARHLDAGSRLMRRSRTRHAGVLPVKTPRAAVDLERRRRSRRRSGARRPPSKIVCVIDAPTDQRSSTVEEVPKSFPRIDRGVQHDVDSMRLRMPIARCFGDPPLGGAMSGRRSSSWDGMPTGMSGGGVASGRGDRPKRGGFR